MKALVLSEVKGDLALNDRPDLQPGPKEVVVQLKAAAFNRRDYWITQGMYPGIELPVILGSDGAGVVSKTGPGVSVERRDHNVLINPAIAWGDSPAAQSDDFQILGMPLDGTFAEEVLVSASQIHAIPDHLDMAHAAALPLGGLTAYRALFSQGKLKEGENVLITGAGGGVATFLVQFANSSGANVFVTSSSPDKIASSVKLGATAGFNYKEKGWADSLIADAGHMNLIIDSAGGAGYAELIKIAAPGGRIVNYGATTGAPEKLDMFSLFWKQLRLIGSTMGSPTDFSSMLDFVRDKKIKPVIDQAYPLADGNQALARMADSNQFGKLVLEI